MSNREKWHEGWPRDGAVIYCGHPHCAGCGKSLGVVCFVVEEGFVPPPEPQWPFDAESCPICELQSKIPVFKQEPQDKLTARAVALAKARGNDNG